MRLCGGSGSWLTAAVFAATALAPGVRGDNILQTIGFSNCGVNSNIKVQKVDITYNASNRTVTFDVTGTSNKIQNVSAVLNVTAYGNQVYTNTFNPCQAATFLPQLCPVPVGTFSARGQQVIPAKFADAVPAIAFQIPDIAAQATLELRAQDTGRDVACITSQVTNGKTANVPAVAYVAAGVAGAALVLTGVSAIGAAVAGGSAAAGSSAAGGMGTISPSFTEVFGWFQGMAVNGMLSVSYPQVYRSFTKNFAFSTGLVPLTNVQLAIDNFRARTGGNISANGVQFLREMTMVFPDGSLSTTDGSVFRVKRAVDDLVRLAVRQIETSVNATVPDDAANAGQPDQFRQVVTGIQAYAQQLSIPSANTFMTVLLVVAIAIAATTIGILLFKIILEFWALFGSFPKSLAGFRKHYWGSIGRTITSLILLLYGIWVLYCIFQFTHGDSWAAKTLAGVTLAIFTGILAFFSIKIWWTARRLRQAEGSANGLYDDKSVWVKYSLFYDSYRKDYWWVFLPTIVYLFAKGVAVAAGDGHGLAQTASLLIIEGVMLVMLVWSRPYERKSGNVVNIAIQVVRVLSVICILVFVQELGIAQTTQTVAGVVLMVIQSALTGVLAILILWNAISICCKANPHRKRRKEMEKMRDMDNLTPLDARNSLLIDRTKSLGDNESSSTFAIVNTKLEDEKSGLRRDNSPERYAGSEPNGLYADDTRLGSSASMTPSRPLTPLAFSDDGREGLLAGAAPVSRQPTLPVVGGYGGGAYRSNSGGSNNSRGNNNYGPTRGYGGGGGGGGGYIYNQSYGYSNGYSSGYGYGPPSRGGY